MKTGMKLFVADVLLSVGFFAFVATLRGTYAFYANEKIGQVLRLVPGSLKMEFTVLAVIFVVLAIWWVQNIDFVNVFMTLSSGAFVSCAFFGQVWITTSDPDLYHLCVGSASLVLAVLLSLYSAWDQRKETYYLTQEVKAEHMRSKAFIGR